MATEDQPKPATPLRILGPRPRTLIDAYRLLDHRENRINEQNSALARLQIERCALVTALSKAQKLRSTLLLQYGAVPECVLDLCNEYRALLRRVEEA